MKSDLAKGLPEQFPLVTKNKVSSTIKSGQYSSINIHVSPDMPVRSILEQGLAKNGRNETTLKGKDYNSTHGEGSVSHSLKVSRIGRSNYSSSGDQKVTSVAASFPGSLPKEESTNFLQVGPNTGFSPAYDICSSGDPESLELHGSNIADLLDMSYCESLMIVPPYSPNHGNSMDGM
jgi:myb proto-oncogene protein